MDWKYYTVLIIWIVFVTKEIALQKLECCYNEIFSLKSPSYIAFVIDFDHLPVAITAKISNTLLPIIPISVIKNVSLAEPLFVISLKAELKRYG